MKVILSVPSRVTCLAVAALVACIGTPRLGRAQQIAKSTRPAATYFFAACTHDETYNPSTYICPDTGAAPAPGSASAFAFRTFRGRAVKRATLTLKVEGLGDLTMELPKGTDAVFFSDHALTKFLAPYYDGANQHQKAEAVRKFAQKVGQTPPKQTRQP